MTFENSQSVTPSTSEFALIDNRIEAQWDRTEPHFRLSLCFNILKFFYLVDNLRYKDETKNMAMVSLQKEINYDPSAQLIE